MATERYSLFFIVFLDKLKLEVSCVRFAVYPRRIDRLFYQSKTTKTSPNITQTVVVGRHDHRSIKTKNLIHEVSNRGSLNYRHSLKHTENKTVYS